MSQVNNYAVFVMALSTFTFILMCVMQLQNWNLQKNFATRDSRGLKVLMEMFNILVCLLLDSYSDAH